MACIPPHMPHREAIERDARSPIRPRPGSARQQRLPGMIASASPTDPSGTAARTRAPYAWIRTGAQRLVKYLCVQARIWTKRNMRQTSSREYSRVNILIIIFEVDKNTPAPRSVFCACNARFNDMPFARAPVVIILRPPAHEYDICFERSR